MHEFYKQIEGKINTQKARDKKSGPMPTTRRWESRKAKKK
jgi:hypothetical protein